MKKDIEDFYEEDRYREYLYSGLLGHLFRYQHRVLSPDNLLNKKKVLEIGPNFEPHIKFAKLNYEEYHCLEINDSKELANYYDQNFTNVIFHNTPSTSLENFNTCCRNFLGVHSG